MMEKRGRAFLLLAVLCYTAAIGLIFYFVGYRTAQDHGCLSASCGGHTFYAVITGVGETAIDVRGMEVNDINHRGDFCLSVSEETELRWRGAEIAMADLDVGDHISVTYTGAVLESDPAQIPQAVAIWLLDDER